MYPDYNNMYNPYNGMNLNTRLDSQQNQIQSQIQNQMQNQIQNQTQNQISNQAQEKNVELITLQEALELIKKSVSDEKADEMFYDEIIRQAPTDKEKRIITSIRDDERKHNRILRSVYTKFTNQTLPEATQMPNVSNQIKKTYQENLETALFGELEAVVKYRRIMGAMPDNDSYTLIMSIMTDEIRHACKYNFLIHEAAKK